MTSSQTSTSCAAARARRAAVLRVTQASAGPSVIWAPVPVVKLTV
ncbi:MAG: hypothetical protein ACR2K0_09855 [Acidimicrobiales bacterium]